MIRTISRLIAMSVLVFVTSSFSRGGEMKTEYKFDRANPKLLEKFFETYGYQAKQVIFREADTIRFRVPSGLKDMEQTGIYSKFALAGDGEVTCSYQIIDVPVPETGYGCGIGLAFDLEANGGKATFQRLIKKGEGDCFVFSSELKGRGGKMPEQYETRKATAKWGQLTMRRIKKEVIFLAKEGEEAEWQEIGRLPFSDRTIRPVRVYVDAGGSPTTVDMRIGQLEIRSEEATPGIPKLQPGAPQLVVVAGRGASCRGRVVFRVSLDERWWVEILSC